MWIKAIVFIITNLPTIIKAIKSIMDMFEGDKVAQKACLDDLCHNIVKKQVAIVHEDGSLRALGVKP